MSLYEQYAGQVHLILNVLPEIAREEVFALKGGTAINLFYRDMPRLSVDIDLTYLPTSDRATAQRYSAPPDRRYLGFPSFAP